MPVPTQSVLIKHAVLDKPEPYPNLRFELNQRKFYWKSSARGVGGLGYALRFTAALHHEYQLYYFCERSETKGNYIRVIM